jgi:hypothetical protein
MLPVLNFSGTITDGVIALTIIKITNIQIRIIGKVKYHFFGLPFSHNPAASLLHSAKKSSGINLTIKK